jgi:hypothetical protein
MHVMFKVFKVEYAKRYVRMTVHIHTQVPKFHSTTP